MWWTVRIHWQCSHWGGGSFFKIYEWVRWVWPMRARHKTISPVNEDPKIWSLKGTNVVTSSILQMKYNNVNNGVCKLCHKYAQLEGGTKVLAKGFNRKLGWRKMSSRSFITYEMIYDKYTDLPSHPFVMSKAYGVNTLFIQPRAKIYIMDTFVAWIYNYMYTISLYT